jgi:hypothetical protein
MSKINKELLEPDTRSHEPTQEQLEWAVYGCNTRLEWREFLNKSMWNEYTCDIKNDCYIGTSESNLAKFRKRKED